ncbi:hypothetical protein [Rhodococcus sp. IEGM 1307]|uniref:hypothetical protein n=1 Tax=Rhodococcus sp. IEGM 1307 TaxID=3047091 RepID=UPI0024B6C7D7|nr:hypothetical protein [Rhodococcus sp. IEGM 1307]MDI9979562.1 hypothetical protein [Rhodococcus sp. IEGM 1307]
MEHNGNEPPPSGVLIGNEFARVWLEVAPGQAGDQLRITSVRTGWNRTLPPEFVEKLSRMPVSCYLGALETPFGPEPDLAFKAGFSTVTKSTVIKREE